MNARLTQPISPIWSGETRAERMMNRTPIRKVERVAIRSRQARVSFALWIASPAGSIPRGGLLTRIAPMNRPVIRPGVLAEQVGTDDHRDDEHQRPGHRLRLAGFEPARPGQDQDPPRMPKPTPIAMARRNSEDLLAGRRLPGDHRVEDDDAERCADRVGERALPLQDRVDLLRGTDEVEQRPDHRRAGDDEHGPEHERDLPGEIEEQIGGNRPDRPGDEDPEGHEPAVDASDAAGQLAEVQAEPGFEEDDPDGDRDDGGDQGLAQQCVGVECVDRARAEPEREQHQDRWEPEHLGEQRRRSRQHEDQPSFEQGPGVAQRGEREMVMELDRLTPHSQPSQHHVSLSTRAVR